MIHPHTRNTAGASAAASGCPAAPTRPPHGPHGPAIQVSPLLLEAASGEANLRLLGAGQALEFDAGKVLETWMASASTYEKVPGEPRPPE